MLRLILVFSCVLILIDFVYLYFLEKSRENTRYGKLAVISSSTLILVCEIVFVSGFIRDDFSLVEVYEHSSSTLSFLNKISASWAASGGSLLLLLVLISLTTVIYRVKISYTEKNEVFTAQVMEFFTLFFSMMVIGKNPFNNLTDIPYEGFGLNPSLKSIWMAAHPPIVFLAYALILLAFSLALSKIKTGKTDEPLMNLSASLAWLFLTIGIASGGIWAYEVLGWGGYWSWDPVETCSLLTWIALTLYFHVKPVADKNSLTSEFLLLITFDSLVFLSALTRGGFKDSVHAYALSPAGPFLMSLLVGVSGYFIYYGKKTGKSFVCFKARLGDIKQFSLVLSIIALAMIYVISLTGVIQPMIAQIFIDDPTIPSISYYNKWNLVPVYVFSLALMGCNLRNANHRKIATSLASIVLLTGVFTVLMQPTSSPVVNLGVAISLISLITTIYDTLLVLTRKVRLHGLGTKILHIGIALTMIGILVSSGGKSAFILRNISLDEPLGDEYSFTVISSDTVLSEQMVYSEYFSTFMPEYSHIVLDSEVEYKGQVYTKDLDAYLYVNYGYFYEPSIIRTPTTDVYFFIYDSEQVENSLASAYSGLNLVPGEMNIIVETVPWINILWLGILTMITGITMDIIEKSSNRKHSKVF